ncbi:MAG: hypothetical protein RBR50_02430 [Candidatus Izemoplasmatales bacterium]|nr:hypothetical protein [Candidatus Izemoplasmatales bacterium]
MKKTLLIFTLLLSFITAFLLNALAVNYSPNYLPGGKNYISKDNMILEGDMITSIDSFLVKPYTNYTVSFLRDDLDQFQGFYFEIYYYDNETLLTGQVIESEDFLYDKDLELPYATFKTPAGCNYISFEMAKIESYISGEELLGFQIEEGIEPTTYESYIRGAIIDTTSPYFIGSSTIVSFFDQPITIEEIKASLSAYDDIDGDLTPNIQLKTDNYSSNIGELGSYTASFSVSDSSSNTTTINVNIQVVDAVSPVFSNIGVIKIAYPNSYTTEQVKAMLIASDNYDGTLTSDNISVVSDGYTENCNFVGKYEIEFKAVDSSGNEATYIQEVEVVDEEKPIITGTDSFDIGYDQVITTDYIKSLLSVSDNYDDLSTTNIVLESNNYENNKDKIGNYQMEFSVTDSSNNKTTKIITINVIDSIGPVVYFDSSIIQVYTDTVLELPDFVDLLVKTAEIDGSKDYFVKIKFDSYSKHSNIPGNYHMYLDLEDGYGKVTTKEFRIKVIDRSYDYIRPGQEVNNDNTQPNKPYLLYGIGTVSTIALGSGGYFLIKLMKRRKIS